MDKYIKRETVIKLLREQTIGTWKGIPQYPDEIRTMQRLVKEIPAADVVEVRHGRWIGLEYDGYADGCPVYDLWECSECGEEVRGEDVPDTHPWCHWCGARMDGGDDA